MQAIDEISHVPPRAAEDAGDLFLGHLVGVVVSRDRGERWRDAGEQISHDRREFRVGGSGDFGGVSCVEESCASLRIPDAIEAAVGRRAVQPGRERALPAKARAVREESFEDILDDFTCVGLVAEDPPRAPKHVVSVRAIQRVDGCRVQELFDYHGVGGGVGPPGEESPS